ncbi:uncharacterized protein FOMMEDRAFT_151911 [Fomitiporia mediterranea MF3/22]|uniref:uncharacterized protein n=1 Tax=Fomitiporia mediterranea (strain MF3/22) TaxID=694068 RepID=UPI0004408D7D|nr:uncharacterized protein FOMMEDRAFT_151911 [Fomitiporia mediterranea MF3/22]EJD06626.1 hypothetical protein FOMMEDRAFT_151911 [Fomitiporia mediterranea MF3/22]
MSPKSGSLAAAKKSTLLSYVLAIPRPPVHHSVNVLSPPSSWGSSSFCRGIPGKGEWPVLLRVLHGSHVISDMAACLMSSAPTTGNAESRSSGPSSSGNLSRSLENACILPSQAASDLLECRGSPYNVCTTHSLLEKQQSRTPVVGTGGPRQPVVANDIVRVIDLAREDDLDSALMAATTEGPCDAVGKPQHGFTDEGSGQFALILRSVLWLYQTEGACRLVSRFGGKGRIPVSRGSRTSNSFDVMMYIVRYGFSETA